MLPLLFHFGHLRVFSYGILTALGFLLAILWPAHLAKKENLSAVKMEGLALVIVITAGIGSKLLTALDYPGFYSGGWNHFFYDQMLGKGGVFYGGFLLAAAGAFLYCRTVKLPFGQISDCVAPGLALAQGLGRVGCFLAGCCWGTPTHLSFGVTFNSELAHQLTGVPLDVRVHPTQLYEAAVVFGVVPFLLWLRQCRTFYGAVILFYVAFYAVVRFFIEYLRDDPRGYYFGMLSTSQIIALAMALLCLGFWLARRRHCSVDAIPRCGAIVPAVHMKERLLQR
jgi:phosphatidylglycerol:prolipoprotein diacylglycerol transferase